MMSFMLAFSELVAWWQQWRWCRFVCPQPLRRSQQALAAQHGEDLLRPGPEGHGLKGGRVGRIPPSGGVQGGVNFK